MAHVLVERRGRIPGWEWLLIAAVALFSLLLIFSLSSRVFRVMTDPAVSSAFVSQRTPCTWDAQCASGQLCLGALCTAIQAGQPACRAAQVLFPAGSADIAPEERPVLDRVARCLMAGQTPALTLGRRPDPQQGRDELEAARVRAVARYLEERGATTEQIRRALPAWE
jgi:hypothetical protein